MALVLGDNFSYGGSKPLDARLKYNTLAEMKAVADSTMYDGCTAYCVEADKTYQWKSTNTVDETLGRWREFASGGSGGHTIEDSEGTDLTQRDTLQFGEGFKAEDDDTNEKTVISPDVMQSGDMSDVITPLPSVQPRYQKYSTNEQVVGEWIDGKPIYQKVVLIDFTKSSTTREYVNILDMSSYNVDTIVNGFGSFINDVSSDVKTKIFTLADQNARATIVYDRTTKYLQLLCYEMNGWKIKGCVTIQYTKTTD